MPAQNAQFWLRIQRFATAIVLGALVPSAWSFAATPALECPVVLKAELSPRERLVKTIITANVHWPQINSGIQIAVLSVVLNGQMQGWLYRASQEEIAEIAEKMNRAHAAYGVRFRTEGEDEGYTVRPERLAEIINHAQSAAARELVVLARKMEPDNELWKRYRRYRLPGLVERREELVSELQKFFERQRINDPASDLGAFKDALIAAQKTEELNEASRVHRETIRELMSTQGRVPLNESRKLSHSAYAAMKKLFRGYLRESPAAEREESIAKLFFTQ